MAARVPSALILGRSTLSGHDLRFHKRGWKDGTGKANAFRTGERTHVVHGVVYEMDEGELADLDVHETGYERRLLTFAVATAGGPERVEAWVYLARPEVIDDGLLPTAWYLDHVRRGAEAHGLPTSLIERLARQATGDPGAA